MPIRPLRAALAACLLPACAIAQAQSPSEVPEEIRALLKEVERAYPDPVEIDKDIIDEVRKLYRDPTPQREAKVFREIRRLYATTPLIEEGILRELRRTYQQPSAEQEARLFEAVRSGGQLPPGAIHPELLAERSAKAFAKLDQNKDGVLSSDELPDVLRTQVARWDHDRDGSVDPSEYLAYFQASVSWVGQAVAAGELPLKLPKPSSGGPASTHVNPAAVSSTNSKSGAGTAERAPRLPDWFTQLDDDQDRQVGLYEWKKSGRPIREFQAMDRNNDGFLESRELLAYLAAHPEQSEKARKRR